MKNTRFLFQIFTVLIFRFSIPGAEAQVASDNELYKTLKIQDSTFFERAFNRCDIEYLKSSITDNLRFYHDQSGITNKQGFLESTAKNICGDLIRKPIRKVRTSTLEVYPLYNNGVLYGAIQSGYHDFYLREEGKEDLWTSKGLFTHVWLLEDGHWKLDNVLSFQHSSQKD